MAGDWLTAEIYAKIIETAMRLDVEPEYLEAQIQQLAEASPAERAMAIARLQDMEQRLFDIAQTALAALEDVSDG